MDDMSWLANRLRHLTPLPPRAWDRDKAAHLLSRAGFGSPPPEIGRMAEMGLERAVNTLLYPERTEFRFAPPAWSSDVDALGGAPSAEAAQANLNYLASLREWWMRRMLLSPRMLEEKMTLFWHSHFATDAIKVPQALLLYRQNELFRQYAFDFFEVLLIAVARDPAMVRFLDTETNRKGRPNDNFARELMELYSLGEGNYTERDVREAARAFTGWTIRAGKFHFEQTQHDAGEKTFLGQTGNFDGVDIIRIIMRQEAVKTFVPVKLFEYFVHPNPSPEVRADLAEVFVQYHFNIRELLRVLFMSELFYADRARGARIKSPVEYVIGTFRRFGLSEWPAPILVQALNLMGQHLFHPPDVNGWKEGKTWINSNTLMIRYHFAHYFTTGEMPEGFRMRVESEYRSESDAPPGRPLIDVRKICAGRDFRSPEDCLDAITGPLLGRTLTGNARLDMARYLQTASNNARVDFNLVNRMSVERLESAIYMLMCSSEYQVC